MNLASRTVGIVTVGLVVFAAVATGQRTNTPQPRADQLPPIGPARPNRGANVPPPPGASPTVPAGFSVSVYADLQ